MNLSTITHTINSKVHNVLHFLFNEPIYKPVVVTRKLIKRRKKKVKVDTTTEMSQFTNLSFLLDSLKTTFKEIKKLSCHENKNQNLIKLFGPFIFNLNQDSKDKILANKFESLVYGFPSFIINYSKADYRKDEYGDKYLNNFFMAVKNDKPSFSKKKNNCVYYTCSYNVVSFKGVPGGFVQYFEIEVNTITESVTALPMPQPITTKLAKRSKGKNKTNYGSTITSVSLTYPDFRELKDMKNPDGKSRKEIELSKKDKLEKIFYLNFNINMRREYNININVAKGDYKCSFSIPQDKWKDFFKDRIKIKTQQGNTKPIFHCVTSHMRDIGNKLVPVKTHYRGLRHFNWKGYKIAITMPGKDSVAKSSLDITGVTEDQIPKDEKKNYVEFDEYAAKINKVFGY